jgi:predicted MFS family arabinose efflux permease
LVTRQIVCVRLQAILVPLLSFSTTTGLFVLGSLVWGAGMGIHDSTMRAAVADFVPAHRRRAGYGTFTAIYGLAWLAGAAIIGLLYEHSTIAAVIFVSAVQLCALLLLIPLLRRTRA